MKKNNKLLTFTITIKSATKLKTYLHTVEVQENCGFYFAGSNKHVTDAKIQLKLPVWFLSITV